ncbi:MAG TPA: CoA transferase [Chloroflexota bacterium]|jgi:benzylsuccinate CoA-transferase BbsF subunit|nr:CoA transferase [Chloroflexota bacterium]
MAAVQQPARPALREGALSGVRVVEFAVFAAGPVVGKLMANYGAEVIRVESHTNPDGFRTHYPPFAGGTPGLDRSGCFALFNDGKLGVTLNLKVPAGVALAKRLVARADVVVENFTPGTIERLGLGYEALRAVKPDLVMLSSCNMGQTGPYARHPGFGSMLSSLGGFTHLTGYPGELPLLNYGPYIDFIGAGYGLIAVLAALDHRRRTGQGQHIDLAQYECGLQFVIPALLDYVANGRLAERAGNRSEHCAPQGAFPCRGDDAWCTISVTSDAEWEALRRAMGDPEWARDPAYATVLGRKAHEDAIEARLAEWTRQYTPRELMALLQAAGVPAAAVNTMADLYSDPQLAARGFWQPLPHPAFGTFRYESGGFTLSETPQQPGLPSPCLGEHNEYVFRELLGLSAEEFADLRERQVIY